MTMRSAALTLALVTISFPASLAPAHAISMQECSAKYKAAQTAGTLKGMKWNDFRKAECSDDAAAKPAAATTAAPKADKKEAAPAASTPATAPTAAATAATGKAVFPTAVSPKYSKESEGKARMHTCLDQYNANKAT